MPQKQLPPELLILILDNLSPVELESFSRCNRKFQHFVKIYKTSVFRIEKIYGTFFDPPEVIGEFQDLQGSTGLVVSGSTALGFFTRGRYAGDLDTYCQLLHSRVVGHWYQSHGYGYVPTDGQLDDLDADIDRVNAAIRADTPTIAVFEDTDIRQYKLHNIAAVWNFRHGPRQIQLVATKYSPLKTILSFHSTCVMNVVTHRAAYCLYPKLTLESRATLLVDMEIPLTEVQAYAVDKYVRPGFSVLHEAPIAMTCNPFSALNFLKPRFIGDKHCFQLPLEYLGKTEVMPDFIEANSWSLVYLRKFNTTDSVALDTASTFPYIVATSDHAEVERRLYALRKRIDDGILNDDEATLTVQTLMLKNTRRVVSHCCAQLALKRMREHVAERTDLQHLSSAVLQQFYELMCIFDSVSLVAPLVTTSIVTNNSRRPVIRVSITVRFAKPGIDWDYLRDRMRSFVNDGIVLRLICGFQ